MDNIDIDSTIHYALNTCGELRKDSFVEVIRKVSHIKSATIIETGTLRNPSMVDGASTAVFSRLSCAIGSQFFSVDNCQAHIDIAKLTIKEWQGYCTFSCCDSVEFLSKFYSKIDVLYLDSYDYSEHNPLPSQIHQVAEIGAAYGKLSDNAIVLIDDCNIPGGGKGMLTSQFLLERGWKLIHDKYQKLFVRN